MIMLTCPRNPKILKYRSEEKQEKQTFKKLVPNLPVLIQNLIHS